MNDTQNERGEEIRATTTAKLLLRDIDDLLVAPRLAGNRASRVEKWKEIGQMAAIRANTLMSVAAQPRKPRVVAPEASSAAS